MLNLRHSRITVPIKNFINRWHRWWNNHLLIQMPADIKCSYLSIKFFLRIFSCSDYSLFHSFINLLSYTMGFSWFALKLINPTAFITFQPFEKPSFTFTLLEKAATFNRWSLPIEGDGGLKPPSPQTAHPVRKLLPNGVKKRSSLTGFTGRIFILYLLLYGIFCFIIEFFRGNPRGSFWIFPTSQWISMLIVIAGIISREWLLREPS